MSPNMYTYCGFFQSTCEPPPVREVQSHDGMDLSVTATVTTLLLTILYSNIKLGSYRVYSIYKKKLFQINYLVYSATYYVCFRPVRSKFEMVRIYYSAKHAHLVLGILNLPSPTW